MQPITSLNLMPSPLIRPMMPQQEAAAAPATSFQDALWQALEQTNTMTNQAQGSIEQSLVGDDLTMVESFTAFREADLALRMMLQIRNKLVDAYQEIQQLRM
ncbi:MAG: flagellar hook-basal body complex protein FliE [Planctomycetaceae bacterium]